MADEKREEKKKGFTVNDQRWWLQDDYEPEEAPSRSDARKPTVVEQLEERIAEKDKLLTEYIHAHKSSVADMDGARARLEKDLDRRVDIEKSRLAEMFLDSLEALERLLAATLQGVDLRAIAEGLTLVMRQLDDRLAKLGLKPVETLGKPFDPKFMEALMTTEVDPSRDGVVLEEIRPGFLLKDQLVRPAGVRVGVAKRG